MVERPLPVPGEIVAGKYRIDSTIGQGGMGVVLGAFDLSLGRQVAMKFLLPARAANDASAARFAREARAAASIQSEHVVRVHEVGALPNGAPFIVMEFLHGADLSSLLQQRGGLPVDYACDLVLQACEALGHAHARGIVHRDLKPQNLFLVQRPDGAPLVKVLDFGISKVSDTDESSPKLTSTEMVMGTPLYMSPEQVRSLKNVDARADIWALGAILFELLAATPPFDGPSASALHASIAMDPPQPLRARRPDVPQHIEAVVLRCLEKDPARRFQSVHELAAAIAPFATERGRHLARTLTGTGSSPHIVSVPPAGGLGAAPTMSVHATNWQQATSTTAGRKSTNVPLILALALGGSLLTVGAVGGVVAYFAYNAKPVTETVTVGPGRSDDVAPPAAPAVAPTAEPAVTSAAPSPPPPPPSTAPTPSVRPVAPARDAGPAKPSQDELDRIAADNAQANCKHERAFLAFARTAEERRVKAENHRARYCKYSPAIRCERDLCRDACTVLHDETCRLRYENYERSSPAKY